MRVYHTISSSCFSSILLTGSSLVTSSPTIKIHKQQSLLLSKDHHYIKPIRSTPDTSNLIFASFSNLLQQWPNSFYPTGHSIVPGIIPRGTRLYHGTNLTGPPNGMEWLAFDPPMGYIIAANSPGPSVMLFTYEALRPLRVIYLDGQSASVGTAGYQDSQTALINGTVPTELPPEESIAEESLRLEYERAKSLCKIGLEWGFEGIVRMNAGFELIWCDFEDGLELVSHINATDPLANEPLASFYDAAGWEWTRETTRRYHDPGERRVELDPAGFISFYDRLPNLSQLRASRGFELVRDHHRLNGITPTEVSLIKDRLKATLARKNSSGWVRPYDSINWFSIFRTVRDHYEPRIRHLALTLRAKLESMRTLEEIRRSIYFMLMPYYDLRNGTDIEDPQNFQRCFTAFSVREKNRAKRLTESENVLLGALEGTLERICGTTLELFSEVCKLHSTHPNSLPELESSVMRWSSKLDNLIRWLDWPKDSNCNPSCDEDEICLVPVWPMVRGFSSLTEFPLCVRFNEIDIRHPKKHNSSH
ncbi:hypothetical protein CROQUDRAFT_63580 [Cronartium quercuum f. sp. fusiforme G11]|uniref:Uncharacterized protein n=1 Tax=Cronartium quercuum f. sp. fusiforme G11 TaxID=708437 RepID=A0A9P6TCL0_9BASI|nr:hypothetical protein CROQUDRAFT_63580 [Cronartium quercuum f. sp. fusiforme G11]